MEKYDLSILIPARNEQFLAKTIEDILTNIRGNTEIIAVLDGAWANPPIPQHDRVTVVYLPESIGQRAATNLACKLSNAKYVMKCDAHCAFDEGFDVKMMDAMQDNWTMVPIMRNLHAFDWVCEDGHRRYQGPSGPCKECGKETKQDVVWIAKKSPESKSYRFDKTLHFQYFGEFNKRPEGKGDITETMSLQGSCFMLTRKRYWELDICEEDFGSWGQQGVEIACKTWLSGGRVVVNHHTWYAHMFRTQGGDFGFPYPLSGKAVDHARKYSRDLFLKNTWDKSLHNLSWLIEKFAPVPGWEDLTKGIVYYTDSELPEEIAKPVREQLQKANLPIVSVSLLPLTFGDNIVLNEKRGVKTMYKQILAGLEKLDTDIVFLCEHDIFYHPSHFDFTPDEDKFYFNTNVWKADWKTGKTLKVDDCKQLSGLCAYRKTLIDFCKKQLAEEKIRHYEPQRNRVAWQSPEPNIDIRHEGNLTKSRWSKAEFRNQKYTEGWTEGKLSELWYEPV